MVAILKCRSSKATVAKAVKYVMNPEKCAAFGCLNLDPNRSFAEQFRETAQLWKQSMGRDERKYYHAKISFAPDDSEKNGGKLNVDSAYNFGYEFAQKTWPGQEVLVVVHDDKNHLHIHFLVNAVHLETGKKLDISDWEYRQWKKECERLCEVYELTQSEYKKKTKEAEELTGQAEKVSKAEIGIREREGIPELKDVGQKDSKFSWKDELRVAIDYAKSISHDFQDFLAELAVLGIECRNTKSVISYRHPLKKKPIRGDSLGDDYTKIRLTEYFAERVLTKKKPAKTKKGISFEDLVKDAANRSESERGKKHSAKKKSIGGEERWQR